MMVTVIACGLFMSLRSGGFVFRHLGHIFKCTLGSMKTGEPTQRAKGTISVFEASCVAIGSSVGVGNISGVAAAIAVGGPGAVFWMWLWAFFGMTIKMAEVSLACYYRSKDVDGQYYGGPSYYMEKGLAREKGWKWGLVLAGLFDLAFMIPAFSGSQAYTIADALNCAFSIPEIPFTVLYSCFIFYIIWKGVPRIAAFASKTVPFMCLLYLLGGIFLIVLNIQSLPGVLGSIFKYAFKPAAAFGGFTGSAVAYTIRVGLSRSINSNEAGMGTSPMIHASSNTIHPVRQGLWGALEVFIDTFVVCSVTALSILCTGTWTSGLTSAALTIESYRSGFGMAGVVFIGILCFLFGLTTTAGFFSYYTSVIAHACRNRPKLSRKLTSAFRWIYPWPNVVITCIIVLTGEGPNTYWAFMDCLTVLPVFFNVISLVLLSGVFARLLKDYRAKYLHIGTPDPDFSVFYDTGGENTSPASGCVPD